MTTDKWYARAKIDTYVKWTWWVRKTRCIVLLKNIRKSKSRIESGWVTVPINDIRAPELILAWSTCYSRDVGRLCGRRHGALRCFTDPFLPTVAFNICCPRDSVSRHNRGTAGAPLNPTETIVLCEHYRPWGV